MKPIRLPVTPNNFEDDTRGVKASPKFSSNMFNGGRHRKSFIAGESLGCLDLLDAGEQMDRPRAFPSTGEVLPTNVKALPTVHVHRPRAVLSSPENDELISELQGQQLVKSTSSSSVLKAVLSPSRDLPHAPLSSIEDFALILSSNEVLEAVPLPSDDLLYMEAREKAVLSPSEELPHAPLSSIEDFAPSLFSKEVIKALPTPPDDLLCMGAREKDVLSPSEELPHASIHSIDDADPLVSFKEVLRATSLAPEDLSSMGARETSHSEKALSCSTSSNGEHTNELNELSKESVDVKQNRSLVSAATKGKKINPRLSSESRIEQNGNEENLSSATIANRMAKKHSRLSSNAYHGPAKQQLPKPAAKGDSRRVLRPWY